jgi:modulator of FtsH protease HflC
MEALMRSSKLTIGLIVAALIALFSSVVVVDETKQVVVVRLGEPIRVINKFRPNVPYGNTGAGVSARIPFFEELVWVDKRLLTFPMERQLVQSTDQLRLEVDAYARIRIIDPVKMVKTAGSTDRVIAQLQPILSSVLREELGKQTFQSLLTAERGAVMARIRTGLDKQARGYGAQVIDVRIKSADLPAGALDAAFASMQAAREKEATTIRAQGQRDAQVIVGDGEARAAQIYAQSYGKDPSFYDFYRAMKSYEATFANPANKGGSTILLAPDNDYLRQFKGGL